MSELRIKNRSESDLRSCEVTKAVTKKAQTPTGFEPIASAIPHNCEDHFNFYALYCCKIHCFLARHSGMILRRLQ